MRLSLAQRLLACFSLVVCSTSLLWGQEHASPLGQYREPAEKSGKSEDSSTPTLHIDHIFNGAINRRGDIVGVHHRPSAPKQMRLDGKLCNLEIRQTSPGGEKDVVTAKIILRDPASGKVVREKFSTLFPAAWGKADIEQAIREAYRYAKEHGGVAHDGAFHGRARGIKIDGYLTERGDAIATAFPVFQGPPKKSYGKGSRRE